jgi:periplasmic protein TonB
MSDPNETAAPQFRTEPGHLAVKVDGLRPDELIFSFERQPKRMSSALVGSLLTHGLLVLIGVGLTLLPEPKPQAVVAEPNREIVYLAIPGPGGGGGGGGDRTPDPPRKAELPGKDKLTVPAVKPPDVSPKPPEPEPPKPENLTIPAKTIADSDQPLPGVVETVADLSTTAGSGTDGGGGTGPGGGSGPGRGPGLGPGEGGGMGGGVYRAGSGVELPRVIREVKPQYTADAMRAKVQGVVMVEAIVQPDGSVGNVQIVRSLDQTFGLDHEALKAAKQWRFVPGTRFGRPVPVAVTIELTFTLR